MTSPGDPALSDYTSVFSRLRTSWFGAFTSVFIARIIASAATFLTIAILGRTLGRAHYGDLVILLTILKVASEMIGPALDTALVRFVGTAATTGAPPQPYVSAVLRAKLALSAAIVLAGVVLAWPIQRVIFTRDALAEVPLYALGLAFAGAALTVLYAFVQTCFQAQQRFTAYASIEVTGAVLRLAAIGALAWLGYGTVTNLFAAYAGAPLVVAAAAWLLAPIFRVKNGPIPASVWTELWHFTKWVIAACAFTSLAQRVDIFLIAGFKLPPESISDYCAAVQLTLLGDLVIATLFNVLLPQASRLRDPSDLTAFLRSFAVPTAIGFACLLPLLAGSRYIAHATFGNSYADTGALFAILLVGTGFALGSAPAGATLYGLGKSRSIAALECVKVAGILTGGVIVVPRYGIFGMAWVVAAVKGTIGAWTYYLALRTVQQKVAQ